MHIKYLHVICMVSLFHVTRVQSVTCHVSPKTGFYWFNGIHLHATTNRWENLVNLDTRVHFDAKNDKIIVFKVRIRFFFPVKRARDHRVASGRSNNKNKLLVGLIKKKNEIDVEQNIRVNTQPRGEGQTE